jgi:histidine triad (HIT) family protein
MTDCPFCRILARELPASVVFRDELACAFLDIRPVNPGHVLVVPVGHASNLSELDEEVGCHLFQVAQRVARALRSSDVRCQGVNLLLADGAVAGQEVFHVHLHVIPRFEGDGFGMRRGAHRRRTPARDELDGIAEQLRERI